MAYTRKASVSQINLYNQCPHKWAMKYLLHIKEPKTEALTKGSLVHAAIEKFHQLNPRKTDINLRNYRTEFYKYMDSLLDEIAYNEKTVFGKPEQSYIADLEEICGNEFKVLKELEDVREMLHHYVTMFIWGFEQFTNKPDSNFPMAFYMSRIKLSELELSDDEFIGFIDQVVEIDNKIIITDIKTSKCYKLGYNEEYRRQTMIYAYKYYKQFGVMPDLCCIYFVRSGIQAFYEINKETLIDECEKILNDFFEGTKSEDIRDYALNCNSTFCSCALSNNPTKNWCFFKPYCDQEIKKGDADIIEAVKKPTKKSNKK